ncbi:glycosyltransferase [Mycobacterium vulneris]|jgi:UDP:flavonoid glycosyltransferase YjiC (YdhE family)|uniref:Glycosyltransferase n=1 Tax=Mycolicibacterium vulneris TaxID=547163 RepID=A0A1X2KQF0_9MYCO|nr:glycosyltransferase [Mycolicibacterium vulneris]OSC23996.1 glycosyltransferase [Mycolicibacterium vulneris]
MKVLLAAYGTRGDVEPLAAVGRELLRRGHDVCMAAPPHMCGFVESVGLDVVAWESTPWQGYGDFIGNANGQIPFGAMVEIMEHVARAWAEWCTTLLALAKGADLLVVNKGGQGRAAIVAEYHDIPLAVLSFFPGEPPRLDGMLGHITRDAEDAQRRALGLPETTGSFESLEIHAYDELCFPEMATELAKQGGRSPFIGALTLESPTDAYDEVLSWIAAGTPPIYFGFGSMSIESPAHTIAAISAACAHLGERALVCAGWSDFSDVPHFEHVKVVDAVNFTTIFPTCRAVVHHGGSATTAAGLRAGVPTLILWFSVQDQPMWAAAVERLEVGAGRAFSESTAASLVTDLRSILTPQCMSRAREVAAQMTTPAQSVASAADLLEEAVRLGRSSTGMSEVSANDRIDDVAGH